MIRNQSLSIPGSSRSGFGLRRTAAAVLVCVLLSPAALPLAAAAGDQRGDPEVCACGCGKPAGACCCTAASTSPLAMRCSGSPAPDVDPPQAGPLLGPPGPTVLPEPSETAAEPVENDPAFTDLAPPPETPPPRA